MLESYGKFVHYPETFPGGHTSGALSSKAGFSQNCFLLVLAGEKNMWYMKKLFEVTYVDATIHLVEFTEYYHLQCHQESKALFLTTRE